MATFLANGFLESKMFRDHFLVVGHVDDTKQHDPTVKTLLEVEVDARNNSFNNGGIFTDKGQ